MFYYAQKHSLEFRFSSRFSFGKSAFGVISCLLFVALWLFSRVHMAVAVCLCACAVWAFCFYLHCKPTTYYKYKCLRINYFCCCCCCCRVTRRVWALLSVCVRVPSLFLVLPFLWFGFSWALKSFFFCCLSLYGLRLRHTPLFLFLPFSCIRSTAIFIVERRTKESHDACSVWLNRIGALQTECPIGKEETKETYGILQKQTPPTTNVHIRLSTTNEKWHERELKRCSTFDNEEEEDETEMKNNSIDFSLLLFIYDEISFVLSPDIEIKIDSLICCSKSSHGPFDQMTLTRTGERQKLFRM